MGTNYYFFTKDSDLAHKYFAKHSEWNEKDFYDEEYTIVDEPALGYEIHLNKLSWGWRPLFQIHKCFKTFDELKEFYHNHQDSLTIYDEYDQIYKWDEYEKTIIRHSEVTPNPLKWEYSVSNFDREFGRNPKKTLHTVDCSASEAEVWTPFDHLEYDRTRKIAAEKYGVWESWMGSGDFYQYNDPNYKIDWAEGEFS